MPPTFIFARHGEAEHNVAFHIDGPSVFSNPKYSDAPLTEKGILQAQELGKKLSSLHFVDIWSSPLTRCIQTSFEIFEEIDAQEINLHDNLIERQCYSEVCNRRKAKSELLKNFEMCNMDSLPELPSTWIKPENSYNLCQRMYMMIMLLAHIHNDKSKNSYILIVSHHQAIREFTGKDLQNAEYVALTLDELMK